MPVHREPVQEQNLLIAVLGTQNAGKSTILNSLLGAEILPSAHQIETASITQVEHKGELEPGVFECISSTQAPISFGDDPAERRDSHDRVRDWIHTMNKAEGMPQIRVCANLTTLADYTSLGLGGVSVFDIPGTNEVAGKEDRLRVVAEVLRQMHFVCIVVPYTDVGADSVEALAELVREHASESCCVCLFINKMDLVSQDAQEDVRGLAKEKLFAERQRLFDDRPTSMYFTRGEDGLASACRGCDLKSCKLLARALKLTSILEKEEHPGLVKRWVHANELIPNLQEQRGYVGPFLPALGSSRLAPAEAEARLIHDEFKGLLKEASGIVEVWRNLVVDFMQARANKVTDSLDWKREYTWFAQPKAAQAWRRLLVMRRAYEEVSRTLDKLEEHSAFVGALPRLRSRANKLIIKRTRKFVRGIVKGANSEHAQSSSVQATVSWGLGELALISEKNRAASLLTTAKQREHAHRFVLAHALQVYVDDIVAIRNTINDASVSSKLRAAAQKTIERAIMLEKRSFASLSRRCQSVDWTRDPKHPAHAYQPEPHAEARMESMWFKDLGGDVRKVVVMLLQSVVRREGTYDERREIEKMTQEMLKMADQAQDYIFEKLPELVTFQHSIYPVTVEAASYYEDVMAALRLLPAKEKLDIDVSILESTFEEWWADGRRSWLIGRESKLPTFAAHCIDKEVKEHLEEATEWTAVKKTVLRIVVCCLLGAAGGAALGWGVASAAALEASGGLWASVGTMCTGEIVGGVVGLSTSDSMQKCRDNLKLCFRLNFSQYLAIYKSAMKFVLGKETPREFLLTVRANATHIRFASRSSSSK